MKYLILLFFMIFILPAFVCALSPDLEKALDVHKQDPGAALIRKLAKEGIDTTNEAGHTPLIEASYNGYTEVVRALLKNGANPSLKANNGSTALTWAVRKGHRDICALLLEALALESKKNTSAKKKSFS